MGQANQMTKTAAVLGSPIQHSKSPVLHHAAYAKLGLDIVYTRQEVSEQELGAFMKNTMNRVAQGVDHLGFSVTMPLKNAMIDYMDQLDPRVELLGAMNTVVFGEDRKTTGYNTDVDGIAEALKFAGLKVQPEATVGILGSGGTASATVAAAAALGFEAVAFFARNQVTVQEQVAIAHQLGMETSVHVLAEVGEQISRLGAVISTLPAGIADEYLATLHQHQELPPLLDVIYDHWPTVSAQHWQATGATVVSGLEMLLYQAVEQVKLFTQRILEPDQSVNWKNLTDVMAVAVGLPPRNSVSNSAD